LESIHQNLLGSLAPAMAITIHVPGEKLELFDREK
jgi:hypothetical protein